MLINSVCKIEKIKKKKKKKKKATIQDCRVV